MSRQTAGVRKPAVAGLFYPAEPAALRAEVERWLGADSAAPGPAIAVLVPHAGYAYSGHVAGAVYASAMLPRTLVILCPNHTGEGRPVAVMSRGIWRTPLGDALIDEPLADRILEECPLTDGDVDAHRREHSLEVQIPFLQVRMKEFSFVPICVGTQSLTTLTRLGYDLGRVVREWPEPIGIVISSDMSHYITAAEAKEKDMMAIARIEAMDPEGLHRVVQENEISMCGFAPAVAGLTAARDAGAQAARLIAYSSSGDASGDYDSVVGYAGLVIT